jgi:hypothetical protein
MHKKIEAIKKLIKENYTLPPTDYSNPCLLFKIGDPNAKISSFNFSVVSGHTCPYAKKCLAKVVVDPKTGKAKLVQPDDAEHRCFAASQEITNPNIYKSRLYNLKLTNYLLQSGGPSKFADIMTKTFDEKLPRGSKIFRIHVGGDFFSKAYLDGWIQVALKNPDILFYTYTKSYPYFKNVVLPSNFRVVFSLGGKHDKEIINDRLKFAVVVNSEEEAANFVWTDKLGIDHLGLEIDHDDSHAYSSDDKPFALLIHGVQPAGTKASQAVSALVKKRKELQKAGHSDISLKGIGGYSRKLK